MHVTAKHFEWYANADMFWAFKSIHYKFERRMDMKYNVGDKVVRDRDLQFLFNPYHKHEYRKHVIHTITEADENWFTFYTDKGRYNSVIEHSGSAACNEYLAYRQDSGKCRDWCDKSRMLHLEKDKEEIRQILEPIGREQYEKKAERCKKQIEYYEYLLIYETETYKADIRANNELLRLE